MLGKLLLTSTQVLVMEQLDLLQGLQEDKKYSVMAKCQLDTAMEELRPPRVHQHLLQVAPINRTDLTLEPPLRLSLKHTVRQHNNLNNNGSNLFQLYLPIILQ